MTNKVTFSVKKIDAANLAGKSRIVATIIIYAISASTVVFADSSSWWNADWSQAQVINVSAPNNLTDYQINIMYNSINVGEHWNWSNNGSDLRYTGFFSNGTEDTSKTIPYWIENWNATSNTASVWVKANITNVSTINEGYGQIKAYYGNPSAISASNGSTTFLGFGGFDTAGTLDSGWTTKLTGTGFTTITGGYLQIGSGTSPGSIAKVNTTTQFSLPYRIRFRGNTSLATLRDYYIKGAGNPTASVDYGTTFSAIGVETHDGNDIGLVTETTSGRTTVSAANINDMITWDIFANSSKVTSIRNDNGLVNISTTNIPLVNLPLVIQYDSTTSGGGANHWGFIDYIFLTNYTSPEPTYSIGAEQHSDTTPPSLASYTPSTDAVGIDTNTAIYLVFSEGMNQTTFSGVALKDSSNSSVSIFLESYNSATYRAVFRPSGTLGSNKGYTITLAGLADLAGNALANKSWSFTTATSYNITLSKSGANGWNLASLPVVPTNTSIESVISNVKSDIESIWAYNSITGNWSMYAPNNPSSELTQMTAGYGYWINYNNNVSKAITGSGNLIIEGANTPPQRTLMPGWNLIGYYQRENTNAIASKCALFALTNNINDETAKLWSLVFGYDNQNKQSTQIGYASNMAPGQGYWIFMTSKLNTYAYGPGLSSSECA